MRAIHGSVAYAVATGWLHGTRTVLAVPTVAATLAGLAAHRMVLGINTLLVLVMVRHSDTQAVAGLGTTVLFFGATGTGSFLATAVTPAAVGRWGRYAHGQRRAGVRRGRPAGGSGLQLPVMVVCGFLLGAAGQVVKLCADTAMQIDVDDALRGHVFTVQDSLFWMSFILAIAAAAAVIPADGHQPALALAGVGGLPRRAGGARRASAGAPRRRAKVTGMATAGPMVADLRAESDDLDALVAELPADALGRRHACAGLDDRASDRASALDGPRRAVCRHRRSRIRGGTGGGRQRPRPVSSMRVPRSWPSPRPIDCWPTGARPAFDCTTSSWRVADGRKLPWFGPPMSAASMATARLMETWAHGLDVADALGVKRPATARLRSIAHIGVRTRTTPSR